MILRGASSACSAARPHAREQYEKAAKALAEEKVPIVLAKMDADNKANKAVAGKYDVKGFPTIKIFRKG